MKIFTQIEKANRNPKNLFNINHKTNKPFCYFISYFCIHIFQKHKTSFQTNMFSEYLKEI